MAFVTLPPGSRLGRFRILQVLGQGGMGVVYKAADVSGREVALKVLPPEVASEPKYLARFKREAEAAAAVVHPNVVRIHLAGEEGGLSVLALEFVAGGSLKARIRQGAIPWAEAVRLGAGIARGLAAIHKAKLVHRDMKPENVLLDEEGSPKLSDFGLATPRHGSTENLTKTGELLGTLEYISPEQADDAKRVDARSDLYSFGAILYAMVVGRPPFDGTGIMLVTKHLKEAPRPPSAFVKGLPRELEQLILGLLAKRPEDRPRTASEVADELERLAAPDRARRGPPAAVLVTAGVVLGIAATGAAFFALSGPPKPPPAPPPPPPVTTVQPKDFLAKLREGTGFKLETTWGRHDWKMAAEATAAAFTHDGKVGVTGDGLGNLVLWDLETGHELRSMSVPGSGVFMGVSFSPKDDRVLAGLNGGDACVLDAKTGKLLATLEHGGHIYAAAWSPDGTRILTGGGEYSVDERDLSVKLWDARTGANLDTLRPREKRGTPKGIAFLDDGKHAACAYDGQVVVVWDLEKKDYRVFPTTWGRITGLAVTGDGRRAVASSNDSSVVALTDLESGEFRGLPGWKDKSFQFEAWHCDMTRDGSRIIASSRDCFRLWDGEGGLLWDNQFPCAWSARGVAISPDGRRALTCHERGVIRVWDLERHAEIGKREGVDGAVMALAKGKNGLRGASYTECAIDTASERGVHQAIPTERFLRGVALSRDAELLVALRDDDRGKLERVLLDAETGKIVWSLSDIQTSPRCAAFSPSGKVVAVGEIGGSVRTFDVKTNFAGRFATPGWDVTAVVLLDDDHWLGATSKGSLYMGALGEAEALLGQHDTGVTALAADGRRAISGDSAGHVKVWDLLARGEPARPLDFHDEAITALALGGKLGASASRDRTVVVFDVASAVRIARIDLASTGDWGTALLLEADGKLHVGTARGVVHTFAIKK